MIQLFITFDLSLKAVYKSEKCIQMGKINIPVITLDGGAGTGKGTVRRMIAWVLKFHSFDSGVLYRAVGYKARCLNISLSNEAVLIQIARNLNIQTIDSRVFLDDVDQTTIIRSDGVGKLASQVAKILSVRLALRHLQLRMQKLPGLVTDGRDQSSIFDTEFRFFLKTDANERARRRFLQFKQMGIPADYDDILAEIIRRDDSDINNPANPLCPHPNALILDTTNVTAKEVARAILWIYQLN